MRRTIFPRATALTTNGISSFRNILCVPLTCVFLHMSGASEGKNDHYVVLFFSKIS